RRARHIIGAMGATGAWGGNERLATDPRSGYNRVVPLVCPYIFVSIQYTPMSTARAQARSVATDTPNNEVRRLATLLDTSQALTGTIDLKSALHRVLEVLGRHHGAVRSSVVMLDEDTGQLQVEASDGLDRPGYRVSYQLGEGI